MPDIAIVEEIEIRYWFGEQLRRTGPDGKKLTQEQLGEENGVSGSTISRNAGRLKRREPLSRDFRKIVHDKLAAQQLEAKAKWHLEQLHMTKTEATARVKAKRKAREDRIVAARQAEAARVEAQRREKAKRKAKRKADLWADWGRLESARPSWAPAGRLPLLPTVVEAEWFADALSLETLMMGEERMQLDDSLMGWSETWRDEDADKRAILATLERRVKRRRALVEAGEYSLYVGQFCLGIAFWALAIAALVFIVFLSYTAFTWVPNHGIAAGLVIARVVWYGASAIGEVTFTAATSPATLIVFGFLTAVLIKLTPERVRGRPKSKEEIWVVRLAVLSAILLFVAAISWLAAEILPVIT